jgi:hypothetical protein
MRESLEPVGADGELSRGTGEPAGAGIAIGGQELAVATERLDARPLAAGGDPRPQAAPGLGARRASAPRLTEDRPPAQDTRAGSHALGGDGGFCGGDLHAQLGEDRYAHLERLDVSRCPLDTEALELVGALARTVVTDDKRIRSRDDRLYCAVRA